MLMSFSPFLLQQLPFFSLCICVPCLSQKKFMLLGEPVVHRSRMNFAGTISSCSWIVLPMQNICLFYCIFTLSKYLHKDGSIECSVTAECLCEFQLCPIEE